MVNLLLVVSLAFVYYIAFVTISAFIFIINSAKIKTCLFYATQNYLFFFLKCLVTFGFETLLNTTINDVSDIHNRLCIHLTLICVVSPLYRFLVATEILSRKNKKNLKNLYLFPDVFFLANGLNALTYIVRVE